MTLQQTNESVRGYRRCMRCRYSLTGQPILLEDDYRLYMVRCPECGGVAPMSEPPPKRIGRTDAVVLMAFVWLAVVTAMSLAAWSSMFGMSFASGQVAAMPLERAIGNTFQNIQPGPGVMVRRMVVNGVAYSGGAKNQPFDEWWAGQNIDDWLAGGRMRLIDWNALWIWLPLGIVSFTIGCFWGTTLHRQRTGRLVPLLLMLAWIALLSLPVITRAFDDVAPTWSSEIAYRVIGFPFQIASVGFAAAAMVIGLLAGPALARRTIRVCLPGDRHGWAADLLDAGAGVPAGQPGPI